MRIGADVIECWESVQVDEQAAKLLIRHFEDLKCRYLLTEDAVSLCKEDKRVELLLLPQFIQVRLRLICFAGTSGRFAMWGEKTKFYMGARKLGAIRDRFTITGLIARRS